MSAGCTNEIDAALRRLRLRRWLPPALWNIRSRFYGYVVKRAYALGDWARKREYRQFP